MGWGKGEVVRWWLPSLVMSEKAGQGMIGWAGLGRLRLRVSCMVGSHSGGHQTARGPHNSPLFFFLVTASQHGCNEGPDLLSALLLGEGELDGEERAPAAQAAETRAGGGHSAGSGNSQRQRQRQQPAASLRAVRLTVRRGAVRYGTGNATWPLRVVPAARAEAAFLHLSTKLSRAALASYLGSTVATSIPRRPSWPWC
ncbi:hypothetical protein BC567DRAFT_83884 [Phyllosticta citribraziliensis]